MSRVWSNWLTLWCGAVAAFGLVLIGGASEATAGPVHLLLDLLNGSAPLITGGPLPFTLALMGAVSLGWSVTLLAGIRAAQALGPAGRPIWRLLTISVLGWYVIDSLLSVATGFALNALPNTVIVVGFLIPILRSGVLAGGSEWARAA